MQQCHPMLQTDAAFWPFDCGLFGLLISKGHWPFETSSEVLDETSSFRSVDTYVVFSHLSLYNLSYYLRVSPIKYILISL